MQHSAEEAMPWDWLRPRARTREQLDLGISLKAQNDADVAVHVILKGETVVVDAQIVSRVVQIIDRSPTAPCEGI
jgi:hypothetical protein